MLMTALANARCSCSGHTRLLRSSCNPLWPHSQYQFNNTIKSSNRPNQVGRHALENVIANGAPLTTVDSFCYLGSMLSSIATLDTEIKYCLSRGSSAFGQLQWRLWNKCGIRLSTKISVYPVAVVSTLLYGANHGQSTYQRQLKCLDQFPP